MTKAVKNAVILVFAFLIIFSVFPTTVSASQSEFEPRLTAPDSSISYYSKEDNVYFQTGYGMPNCVAYAYGRIYELNGEAPKINHGSAGDWWFINKRNDYYEYGSDPRLGAVACWSGHVAVVEDVSEDGVTLSESHWGGRYFDVVTYSDVTDHYGQTFYGYIYTYSELEKEETNMQYKAEKKTFDPMQQTSFDIVRLGEPRTEEEILHNTLLLLGTL